MAGFGIWRMWDSTWFKLEVWPEFKEKYDLDASKVERLAAKGGGPTTINVPQAGFARGIFEEMRQHPRVAPEPPKPQPPDPPKPPPVDPHYGIAPRTYNYAPSNNSDPRFCKHSPGVTINSDGTFRDKYSRYDTDGRDLDGGRTRLTQVPGLRQADNSDGRGECELYDGLTAWPEGSYER